MRWFKGQLADLSGQERQQRLVHFFVSFNKRFCSDRENKVQIDKVPWILAGMWLAASGLLLFLTEGSGWTIMGCIFLALGTFVFERESYRERYLRLFAYPFLARRIVAGKVTVAELTEVKTALEQQELEISHFKLKSLSRFVQSEKEKHERSS